MGLDMYAYAIERTPDGKPGEEADQIAYWRKHNALHGWMENHWNQLGYGDFLKRSGFTREDVTPENFLEMKEASFNGVKVPLDEETLIKLEEDINNHALEPTGGFFFGSTDYDTDEYKDEDLAFIAKAKESIAAGKCVIYDSWW